MKKRGISPVIATVLLVSMVIVIGLIIFLWIRQLGGETITKFEGQNAQLICGDILIEASYDSGVVSLVNQGNIPVFQMKMKLEGGGEYTTENLNDYSGWPSQGLNSGATADIDIGSAGSADRITLIPVLLGNAGDTQKTFTCDEDQHGIVVYIA